MSVEHGGRRPGKATARRTAQEQIEASVLQLAAVDRSTYVEASVRVPLTDEQIGAGVTMVEWIERRGDVSVSCRCQVSTDAVVDAIRRAQHE